MTVWLLMLGPDYDPPEIVGSFPGEAEAVALRDSLAGMETAYYVQEVDALGPVTVEVVGQRLDLMCGIRWDGTEGYSRDVEPQTLIRLIGLPDPDAEDEGWERESLPPCQSTRRAYESNYTLGVRLDVTGSDPEMVRSVYEEDRAAILRDPAAAVVSAWETAGYLPPWVWARPENAGILDRLEVAGFDRLTNGPIGS